MQDVNYGSIEESLETPIEKFEEVQQKPNHRWKYVLLVIGVVSSVLFLVSMKLPGPHQSTFFKASKKAVAKSTAPLNWVIYKHTTSISEGTYESVSTFINTYLTNIDMVAGLGCNSRKVVGSLLVPSQDSGVAGFEEIHWVDSSIFPVTGMSISKWSDYVSSLGTSNFNTYMHNKVQLYVPNLQPHFSTISAGVSSGDVKAMYRLSASSGSSTNDVAHISVFVENASMVYELVGPASSLTSLDSFSAWDTTTECPSSHVLPYSLEYYAELYASGSPTAGNTAWMESSGLLVPMGIQITIPTETFGDKIKNTMDLVSTMTSGNLTFSTNSDENCQLATLNFDSVSTSFVPQVIYVVNSGASSSSDYTIGDWENQIEKSYDDYISDSGWTRYLDTHIGMFVVDTDNCDSNIEYIKETISSNAGGYQYSERISTGTHMYVGTFGLKSWEFNAYECLTDGYDICGCISSNNNVYYEQATGNTCASNQTELYPSTSR